MQHQQKWALLEVSGGQHKVTCTFLSSALQDTEMMALALLSTSPGQRYHKHMLQEFPQETCTPAPPMAPQSSALTRDLHVQTLPILTSSPLRLPALKDPGKQRLKTYPGEGARTNVLRSHQCGDLGEHPWEQASWELRGKEGCTDNSSLKYAMGNS